MKPDQGLALGIIALAAGKSSRMGKPKLLLPFKNSTILETAVNNLKHVRAKEITFVTGFEAPPIEEILRRENKKFVRNAKFEEGIHSSIQAGLRSLSLTLDAFMIYLCDQPTISSALIADLINHAQSNFSKYSLFAPAHKGRRGHPVIISMKHRSEVMKTNGGDRGCHYLFSQNEDQVCEMMTESDTILKDVDTWAEYQSLSPE